MSSLDPIGNRVLVKRLDADEKSPGGIYIPDPAKKKPHRGIVEAIGQGKLLENGERSEMPVSVGDEVFFAAFSGSEIELEGEEKLILNEEDLLAVAR